MISKMTKTFGIVLCSILFFVGYEDTLQSAEHNPTPEGSVQANENEPKAASAKNDVGKLVSDEFVRRLSATDASAELFQSIQSSESTVYSYFVVDPKLVSSEKEALFEIVTALSRAVYAAKAFPSLPEKFVILLQDSPIFISTKYTADVVLNTSNVLAWFNGETSDQEFSSSIEFYKISPNRLPTVKQHTDRLPFPVVLSKSEI